MGKYIGLFEISYFAFLTPPSGGFDGSFNIDYDQDYDDKRNVFDSCLSWVAGNDSWTPFYKMRCLPINIMLHKQLYKSTITVW